MFQFHEMINLNLFMNEHSNWYYLIQHIIIIKLIKITLVFSTFYLFNNNDRFVLTDIIRLNVHRKDIDIYTQNMLGWVELVYNVTNTLKFQSMWRRHRYLHCPYSINIHISLNISNI